MNKNKKLNEIYDQKPLLTINYIMFNIPRLHRRHPQTQFKIITSVNKREKNNRHFSLCNSLIRKAHKSDAIMGSHNSPKTCLTMKLGEETIKLRIIQGHIHSIQNHTPILRGRIWNLNGFK